MFVIGKGLLARISQSGDFFPTFWPFGPTPFRGPFLPGRGLKATIKNQNKAISRKKADTGIIEKYPRRYLDGQRTAVFERATRSSSQVYSDRIYSQTVYQFNA